MSFIKSKNYFLARMAYNFSVFHKNTYDAVNAYSQKLFKMSC